MMVRFRFGRETSSTAVGSAPKASVCVMETWSLAETGTGLASRAIGIWTLRFAFGRGAGPPEFPTTRFAVAVGMSDETAVPSLGDADDRTDPTDDLSASCAVSSDEAYIRDSFDGDPCPLSGPPTSASGLASDATLRRTMRRLGADHRAAFQARGSEVFGASDTKRRRPRADLASWLTRMSRRLDDATRFQMLQTGSWYPTFASLGSLWSPALVDAGLRR